MSITNNMTDNDLKIINNAITRFLARREHSRQELLTKLVSRGLDETLCRQQIDAFTEQNIQSDRRYAESLVRSRAQKGQGENRIKAELREHNISTNVFYEVNQELEIDWFELARSVALHKYGECPPKDWQEQQKRSRFLQYRGFSLEQIKYAVENSA